MPELRNVFSAARRRHGTGTHRNNGGGNPSKLATKLRITTRRHHRHGRSKDFHRGAESRCHSTSTSLALPDWIGSTKTGRFSKNAGEAADRDQIVSCVDASAIHLRSKTTG